MALRLVSIAFWLDWLIWTCGEGSFQQTGVGITNTEMMTLYRIFRSIRHTACFWCSIRMQILTVGYQESFRQVEPSSNNSDRNWRPRITFAKKRLWCGIFRGNNSSGEGTKNNGYDYIFDDKLTVFNRWILYKLLTTWSIILTHNRKLLQVTNKIAPGEKEINCFHRKESHSCFTLL